MSNKKPRLIVVPADRKNYFQNVKTKGGWVQFRVIPEVKISALNGWKPIGVYTWQISHGKTFIFHKPDIDLNDPDNISFLNVPGKDKRDEKNEIFGEDNCKRKLGGKANEIDFDSDNLQFHFIAIRKFEKYGEIIIVKIEWKWNMPAIQEPVEPDKPEPEIPGWDKPEITVPTVHKNITIINFISNIINGFKSKNFWSILNSSVNTFFLVILPLAIWIF